MFRSRLVGITSQLGLCRGQCISSRYFSQVPLPGLLHANKILDHEDAPRPQGTRDKSHEILVGLLCCSREREQAERLARREARLLLPARDLRQRPGARLTR